MQIRLTEEEVNRINSEIKSGEFVYKDNDKIIEYIGAMKVDKDVYFMTYPGYKRFIGGVGDTIELTKYRLIQIL